MNRRQLLKQLSLIATGGLIALDINTMAVKTIAQTKKPKKLIVIFLRGAIDGLSVLVPHQEQIYYEARPTIAIPKPKETEGVLDLDGRFGLHPALAELMPLWEKRSLAFVCASGLPNATRSHFDAQEYMEIGTPGVKNTTDGWMNRLLATLPRQGVTQAVNIGQTTPRILTGSIPITNIAGGQAANRPLAIDIPEIDEAFARLYSGSDALSLAYTEGAQARKKLVSQLETEMKEASGGAPSSGKFDNSAKKLASLMSSDLNTQLGFLAVGGWDTHINQGNSNGRLATRLKDLASAIAILTQGVESVYSDTMIVVLSEFGRTVAENGNRGTDHGHGNVMWLLGGSLRGGKVYGEWPGLAESNLFEGRDLAITTDFRDVISAVLEQHLEVSRANISQIFPNYQPKVSLNLV